MTFVLVGLAVAFFATVLLAGNLSTDEKKRVGVIFVLFVFAAIFWGAFEQAPTSLNLFANDFTDRSIFGWEMPATWFQSVNSFFIIVLRRRSPRSGCGWRSATSSSRARPSSPLGSRWPASALR